MAAVEKRKISCPLRYSNTDPTARTIVAVLSTLPRLLIPYRKVCLLSTSNHLILPVLILTLFFGDGNV